MEHEGALIMAATAEQLKRAREARWSNPAQRQALAERNRARVKVKPGRESMLTIAASVTKPQPVHTQEIAFLSELKLGLLADQELADRFREAETNVRQLSRLAGPLALNATGKLAQERVNMLSLQNEIQRRQLSRL